MSNKHRDAALKAANQTYYDRVKNSGLTGVGSATNGKTVPYFEKAGDGDGGKPYRWTIVQGYDTLKEIDGRRSAVDISGIWESMNRRPANFQYSGNAATDAAEVVKVVDQYLVDAQ